MTTELVIIQDKKTVTSSLTVAEVFGKEHKNIIRAIENLECSSEFNQLNFEPVEYLDSKGEMRPSYQVTRDGFVFLVMGFTGKKAAACKEAYIKAFNLMEDKLRNIMENTLEERFDKLYNIVFTLVEGFASSKPPFTAATECRPPQEASPPSQFFKEGIKYYTTTEIGKLLGGISVQNLNHILFNHGFIEKHLCYWRIKPEYEQQGYGIYLPPLLPDRRNGMTYWTSAGFFFLNGNENLKKAINKKRFAKR
ncbi:MAG: hypothetical protein A2017_06485 [Lentisphaerae bacterium GWF2_44_16]|nr:MAG: hypothetical protein A2017_06485 [Lentisphaerae bacterium GWF2_44_16]